MSKTRPQRPSADATRNKILQAALQLFMQFGFAGTSMGKLAEKAKINQTLIFHHFGNKQELWQQVKAAIIGSANAAPIHSEPQNLVQFLSEAIEQRISIYTKCPKLKKLISWQKLESTHNKQSIIGIPNSSISPLKWIEPIQFLQAKNLLNPQLKPELIIVWLVASIDGMLDDDLAIFKNNIKNQKDYTNMLVATLVNGLAVSD
jgi:AcrR family transcriptional regulator